MPHVRRALTCLAAAVAVLPAGGGPGAPGVFPVAVDAGDAAQVVTVAARGTYATVTAWQRTGGGAWRRIAATDAARVGAHGVTDGATRVQGSGTTPDGTYPVTRGFGIGPDPGTRMPYHRVGPDDWWVEDPTSAYYNQMRRGALGGFHLTETGDDASEHLVNYPTQYRAALVIDFNVRPAVRGRGAGIFLHGLGPRRGATAGCVAVPAAFLTTVLRWIDPAAHPVVAIG